MSPAWELLLLRVAAVQRSLLCAGRGGGVACTCHTELAQGSALVRRRQLCSGQRRGCLPAHLALPSPVLSPGPDAAYGVVPACAQ